MDNVGCIGMKAGRELDMTWFGIVEKVMGWQISDIELRYVRTSVSNTPRKFDPLNNIADAWLVADKLKIAIMPQSDGAPDDMKYLAEVTLVPYEADIEIFAETAPLAICKAALISVGVEVGE